MYHHETVTAEWWGVIGLQMPVDAHLKITLTAWERYGRSERLVLSHMN